MAVRSFANFGPRKISNGPKITRIAPILTIFARNRSRRPDLKFQKNICAVLVVVIVVSSSIVVVVVVVIVVVVGVGGMAERLIRRTAVGAQAC